MWPKIALAGMIAVCERYYAYHCVSEKAQILRNNNICDSKDQKKLVILSHNVNHELWRGGMSSKRRNYIFSLIRDMDPQPDIITLQEVYRSAVPIVQSVLGDSVEEFATQFKDYNVVFGHSSGIGHLGLELGKLTLTRYEILFAEKKQLKGSYVRSILWTRIDTPFVVTNVYNVHTTGMQSQLREILTYVNTTAKEQERIIIAGDVNLDISSGASGRGILESEGFKVSDVGPTALVGIRIKRAWHWRSIDMIAVKDQDSACAPIFDRVLDTFCLDAHVWPSDHAGIRAELPYTSF